MKVLKKTSKRLDVFFKLSVEITFIICYLRNYIIAFTFIKDCIILEAKRLLMFSDKTSEQITYHLGYNEPRHFSKLFLKNMLMLVQMSLEKKYLLEFNRYI